MESEQRTLALVHDVADTLESVAISPTHTPALYSTFLRAVATSRAAGPSAPPTPRTLNNANHSSQSHQSPQQVQQQQPPHTNGVNINGQQQHVQGSGTAGSSLDLTNGPAAGVFGDEQQFGDGALGLKMFPPCGGNATGLNTLPNGPVGGGVPDLTWTPSGTTPGIPGGASGGGEMEMHSPMMNFQIPHIGGDDIGNMSMDSILAGGFWDNVLIPGYSSGLEGLSGGFVFGAGGSGFITPRRQSPEPETLNLGSCMVPTSPGLSQQFQLQPSQQSYQTTGTNNGQSATQKPFVNGST